MRAGRIFPLVRGLSGCGGSSSFRTNTVSTTSKMDPKHCSGNVFQHHIWFGGCRFLSVLLLLQDTWLEWVWQGIHFGKGFWTHPSQNELGSNIAVSSRWRFCRDSGHVKWGFAALLFAHFQGIKEITMANALKYNCQRCSNHLRKLMSLATLQPGGGGAQSRSLVDVGRAAFLRIPALLGATRSLKIM